jgi:hypothetical protein
MKALIAISSCGDFEANGNNQAMRDTWLKDVNIFTNLDYKFFFGVGQNAPQLEDSVLLPDVDDGYGSLTYKTRASLRWAHERGYTHVFRCFPDTFVSVDRLMACHPHEFDFYGDFRSEEGGRPDGGTGKQMPTLQEAQNYASGGAGYWLSRRAFEYLLDAPILGVWRDELMTYVEDLWVGNILGKCGTVLRYFDDTRFCNHGSRMWPNLRNDQITAHLSCPERFDKAFMYAAHAAFSMKLTMEEVERLRISFLRDIPKS